MSTRENATPVTTSNAMQDAAHALAPQQETPAPTPPDPNAQLEAYVRQTVAGLDTIEVQLGSDPPLTGAEKRHAAKLRKGGDKVIVQIGDLATQHQLESQALLVSVMMGLLGGPTRCNRWPTGSRPS